MTSTNLRTVDRLIEGLNARDRTVMDEVFTDDAVMEWPQSGERIVGAEMRRAVYARLDPLPTVTPRRMLAEGDLVIAEAHLDYGSGAYDCVFIFEMRDGLIAKETAYWATPYDPPDWRAALVERI